MGVVCLGCEIGRNSPVIGREDQQCAQLNVVLTFGLKMLNCFNQSTIVELVSVHYFQNLMWYLPSVYVRSLLMV